MNKEHQKLLVICQHGQVRSSAMAYLIKILYHHQHEVINIGIDDVSDKTFHHLVDWCDKAIFMDKTLVPVPFHEVAKFYLADVGEDVWHNPQAQGLIHKCLKKIKNLHL